MNGICRGNCLHERQGIHLPTATDEKHRTKKISVCLKRRIVGNFVGKVLEREKNGSSELYLFEQSGNFKVIKMPKRKLLQCAIQSKAQPNTMQSVAWAGVGARNHCTQAIVSRAMQSLVPFFFSFTVESLGLLVQDEIQQTFSN